MKITDFSLRRPVMTLMIFLSFVVIGLISSRLLPLEFFPELDAPYVSVYIPYPNSTPEEVEREITRPVEEILATISDVKRMGSTSSENSSNIFLEFEWGIDTDVKTIETKERIESIRSQLPLDVERISIQKFNTADMPILIMRISSKRDLSNSYDMLNRLLKRRIERIRGISKVEMYGVEKKQILIQLLADRIIAHQIDLNRLSQVLRNSNFMVTAGRITDSNRRFTVRPMGEISTVDEINNLIVGDNGLKLRDIAHVSHEMPELDYGRHLNQTYAIGLNVFKESGANIVDVGRSVKETITEISKDPRMEGISLYLMDDLSEGIVSSLNELLKAGLLGAALAIIVLFLFLRQWSTTFIVVLAVPFSLLVTLAFMYFMNLSLNILSMLGLLLAVGMLVDNAVVVTENIYRYQKLNPGKKNTTISAVKEVALAITAGTSTTAIVFLPNIISSKNEIAIYIKHVALSLCVALGASLILAQTVVPLLASRIKTSPLNQKKRWIDRLISRYKKILSWLLKHRKTSVGILLLTLFSIAIPIKFVKSDMFPEQEQRRLYLEYNINDTYTVERVEEAVNKVEDYLFANKDKFEIESVYSYYTPNYSLSTIILKEGREAKKSQKTISEEIVSGLPEITVGNVSFERRRSGGSTDDLNIYLVGSSTEQLINLSHEVAWTLGKIPGFKDVRSRASVGSKEVLVVVNRERAKKYGFSPQEVASNIAVAMRGVNLRRMHDEEGEIEVRVEFQKEDKRNLEQLQNISLFGENNNPVKLSTLADFTVRQGPPSIRRENRITSLGIAINLEDLTVNEAKKKISKVLGQYNFPPGVSWNYGRSFDFEGEAVKTMLINTLLALALIYFVMASLFESLVFPGAIWTSIIFAVVGVWWFFLVTGTIFDLMAWMGVLILIGVVVNNGIVLIDHINQLRAQGLSRYEAIVQAGGNRIRPILMTAGTTILSLVPLCFTTVAIGGNGPPYFPMARAIVGGLAFSTLVTLIILPEIYLLLDDLRQWSRRILSSALK
ncbi:MAG: AcrB/AcrD/AcrF family protein [Candidatus Aminicenantes bacterium]|nr:AcrB/AcrD/AcrF family protein [Candidatus Aminicenantes bacterium]